VTSSHPRRVVFVGGTPFSGAEIVAELLAEQPHAAAPPVVARFHSDARGLPALLGGRIGLEDFLAELRTGEMAAGVPPKAIDAALAAFRDSYGDDPLDACRDLFWALMGGIGGDPAAVLVDASPGNLLEAHTLARLVPEARFVHVVRDGRDVATAAAEAKAAPARLAGALEWWADGLRDVERGIRGEEDGAPYAIPDARLITVVLDELASDDGGTAYDDLLDGVRLEGGHSTRSSARPLLDPAAMGRGRWRTYARGPGSWLFSRRYARALGELAEEGNHAAAPLQASYGRLG
jgi:hypothetical protein